MKKPIYEFPSDILRRKMPDVKEFGPKIYSVITDLKDTLFEIGAVGLAANQIGVELNVCVVLLGDRKVLELINPIIYQQSGKVYSTEACVSLPKYSAIIPRAKEVRIGYRDKDARSCFLRLEGNHAIVAQHELDHLKGILIKDYVEGAFGKSGGLTATEGTLE